MRLCPTGLILNEHCVGYQHETLPRCLFNMLAQRLQRLISFNLALGQHLVFAELPIYGGSLHNYELYATYNDLMLAHVGTH